MNKTEAKIIGAMHRDTLDAMNTVRNLDIDAAKTALKEMEEVICFVYQDWHDANQKAKRLKEVLDQLYCIRRAMNLIVNREGEEE